MPRSISRPSSTRLSSSSSSVKINVFLLFDIAQVKSRFTRESLVTNVSLVHHGGMCPCATPCRVQNEVLPPRQRLHLSLHSRSQCLSTLTSPWSKHASRGNRFVTNVFLVNLTVACVPVKHCATFSLRSFLHESVFILLFVEGHNIFRYFDIDLVKARFKREPLVTTVSSVNLTVARVPEKHRAAFNLRSFLHESVIILLFIEGHNVFLHFDIALVETRCTRGSRWSGMFLW